MPSDEIPLEAPGAETDPVLLITARLRQIAHELSIHSKHILERYHITVPQLLCLQEIRLLGPITLGALTRRMSLNNSTITGIVDRLEHRRLVQRIRGLQDRRQVLVELTAEGREAIAKAPGLLREPCVEALRAMDPEERDQLLWALDRLVRVLRLGSDLPPPPGAAR